MVKPEAAKSLAWVHVLRQRLFTSWSEDSQYSLGEIFYKAGATQYPP